MCGTLNSDGTFRSRESTFNANLDIAALELKFGDIFFDEKIDKFFELFLIHLVSLRRRLESYEFLWSGRKHFATVLGDEDHVFNPDTASTGNVSSRLDGHDHPGLHF